MSGESGCAGRLLKILRIKYRSSESILDEYGRWQPPDDAEARANYWRAHAHHSVHNIRTPVKDLKEFGEGVQMYFYLLKFSAVVFSVLALVPGLLLVVFNGLGGWYDKGDVERTMLGNFGLLTHDGSSTSLNITSSAFAVKSASVEGAVTSLFASTANARPAHVGGMDKGELLVAMSVLDLIGVLIFFGFGMFMIWFVKSRSRAAAAATTAVTLPDYSLQVERLPPDTSAAALQSYILQLAGEGTEIVRVELCRKVDQLLELVMERGQVLPRLDLSLAIVQRKAEVFPRVSEGWVVDLLYERYLLAAVTDAIRREQAMAKGNEVVTAFITFATPDGRRRVMEALPRSLVRRWRTPPDQRFNNGGVGKAGTKPVVLDVAPAPHPSDVQYENLEYSTAERVARIIMSNLAKYLVLLVGFLVVSLAPAMRMGVASSGSGPERSVCDAHCSYKDAAGNFALSATNRTLYEGCDPVAGTGTLPNKLDCESQSVCYECFCRAALSAGEYGEMWYCSRFGSVVAVATLGQMFAVLGIVVANTIIQLAIGWLVRQEKHRTRSREAVGIVRGLFVTQFINTAFSNLVANMYLPGPADVVANSFLNGYIFSGSYADTTPNWYHDVCRPIIISVFLTTVLVHAKIVFLWWWRRRRLARRYECLTQRQLDDAYEGHEFELAVKYGQHLYIIYVVMTYSAGMPLLYTLAAVHFITCFWSEKFELLKVCKRPLAYSRDVAVYVTSSLPFAALWHLALGLWVFSLFGVPRSPLFSGAFRRSLQASVAAFKGLMPVESSLTPQLVAWRFTQNSAGHLFIAFMACGGFIFLLFTLSTWLAAMRSLLRLLGLGGRLGSEEDAAEEARTATIPEFWIAVRSQLLVGPASYAVEHIPAYAHAFVRMEELEWEKREEMFTKAAADAAAAAAAAAAAQAAAVEGPRESRRKRTAASRVRAKQHAAKAAAAGWTYDPAAAWGLPYGLANANKGNKVAPEPSPRSAPDPYNGGVVGSGPAAAGRWDDPTQPPGGQPQQLRGQDGLQDSRAPQGPQQLLQGPSSRPGSQLASERGHRGQLAPNNPASPDLESGLQPQPTRTAPATGWQPQGQPMEAAQGQGPDLRGPSGSQVGPAGPQADPWVTNPTQMVAGPALGPAASQPGAGPRRSSWTQLSPAASAVPGNTPPPAPFVTAAVATAAGPEAPRSSAALGAAAARRQSDLVPMAAVPTQGATAGALAAGPAAPPDLRAAAFRTSAAGLPMATSQALPTAPSRPGPEPSAKSYGGWERQQRPPVAPASYRAASATMAVGPGAPPPAPALSAGPEGLDGRSSVQGSASQVPLRPEASVQSTGGREQPRKWADLKL